MNAISLKLYAPLDGAFTTGLPAIFDHMPMGLCLLDGELRCTALNHRLTALTGCSAEASLGRPLADLLPGLFAAMGVELQRALAGCAVEDVEISGETLGLPRAGRVLHVSVQAVRDADSATGSILVGLMDVTDARSLAATALRESMDHYRHSVEFSPHLPWTADPQGRLLEFSPRWLAFTGLTREETLGIGWAVALHPDDAAQTLSNWSRSLPRGEPVDMEYRIRSAEGAYRWFRARAAARRDDEGRVVRWYGTVEDVHDRKLAEEALRESEAFSRSFLDNSPDCIKVLDLDGRLLFMSGPGLCAMEIDDFAPVRGRPFEEFWSREDALRLREAITLARMGRTARFTAFCATMTGKPRWWDVSVSPIPGPDGRVVRLLTVSRDVTTAKRAQDEIERMRTEAQEAAGRLSTVLESTTDSVILVDRDRRVTYLNRHAAALLAARGLRVGASLGEAFPEEDGGRFDRQCRTALQARQPLVFEEYLSSLGLWLEVHAYPAPGGLSIFFRDITERQRAEHEQRLAQERIAHMAGHDALTGLANRTLFREQVEGALSEAGAGAAAAVLCLDLDGFKGVNDTFGHPAGDALLRQVAERLLGCLRGNDRVARFGGDEFAILQVGQGGSAASLARRLVASLGEPYDLDGQQIAIGASVGIALSCKPGDGASEMIKRADLALYAAKAAGRGTYRFFEQHMDEGLREKQALRTDLRLAVADGGFMLHYQPIFDLRAGRIASFEALLRWPHPGRGDVPPSEFIPVAEETGMILALGEWALRKACREAAGWPEAISVAVNLSPVQFRSRDMVRLVADTLAETGLAPGRLELEITESVLLADNDANLAVLRALKQLGIRIAMDDFGTGYSSLSYLHRFRFDKIKIDRSFVSDLPGSGGARAIVRAMVAIGNSLGVAVTAEGVETPRQLEHLRAEGCDQAQGYLFSKSVPAVEARRLMGWPLEVPRHVRAPAEARRSLP